MTHENFKKLDLRKEIIKMLIHNNGRVSEKSVCDKLNIQPNEIPWGYKIGWSRCLQPDQTFHLFMNDKISSEEFTLFPDNFTGKCCT